MPDSRISALPSATSPLAGTEVLPIVQSGTTDKVTAADLLRQSGQTVTTSNPVLSLAQTWNAGGVTFTGLLFNATNTASATASLLLDLQVGGTSQFKVDRTGIVTAQSAVAGTVGWFQSSITLGSLTGGDTILARDAANTLALRSGVNAQTFNLYKTYTDASNYERLSMFSAGGSEFTFVTQRAGAGAAMNLTLGTYGNAILSFMTGGSTKWQITTSGHFLAATDNTYDIGASGATRPRTVYTGTSFVAPDGSDASPSFTFGTSQTGMYRDSGGGRIRFAVGGNFAADLGINSLGVRSDTGTLTFGNSGDVILARDAANTLAQRNGTNAQTFRVYNTYTDASNYERGILAWESNALFVGTQAAGTGTVRDIFLRRGGTTYLCLGSTFGLWNINSSGHFVAGTDNTYDIGASGATRPRTIYAGTDIRAGNNVLAGNGWYFGWNGRSLITSPSDGVITISNNAVSDFTRLQFGGTTSSFPSLKRNAAGIEVKLADDSGFAGLSVSSLDATTTVRAEARLHAYTFTAIPAGGTAGVGVRMSSVSNFGVFFGSGAPTLSAAKGSLYLRSDGSGTNDRMYVNTDGSTTWTAVTTVA